MPGPGLRHHTTDGLVHELTTYALELKLPAAFDEQFADVKLRIQAVTHAAETI